MHINNMNTFVKNTELAEALKKYNGKYSKDDVISYFTGINSFDSDFSDKSCAVIGSAPNILDKKLGKEIDSHDFIIRSNAARIEGFEDWVGSRTDLRLISGKTFSSISFETGGTLGLPSATWFPRLKNEHFIVRPYPSNLDRVFGILDLHMNGNNKISYIDRELETYSNALTNGKESTTGFIAIILAVMLFKKVNIYGYSFYGGRQDAEFPSSKYYTMAPLSCGGLIHSFKGELEATKNLESEGYLSIRT